MYRLSGHLTRNKHSNTIRVTYKLKKLKTIQNPQLGMADAINLTGDLSSEERVPGNEEATQDHMCCCTVKHETKTYLEAHLLSTTMCFWTLTKKYWSKREQEAQYCSICKEVFENAVALQRHCFYNVTCKLHYLRFYFRDNKSQNSSRSEHVNTEYPVSSASTSQRSATPHSSGSSNPSTPVMSDPNSATASVAGAAFETNNRKWPYCSKSFKEESRLKAHITKVHKNAGQWNRSGVSGDGSKAEETQSTRREMLTPVRSSPNSATASVTGAAGEKSKKLKCPYCPKSYKEESSLKGHITKIHKNGGKGNISRVSGNGSAAGEAQSARRKKLNGSHKGFVCGKCLTFVYTRKLFIAHVMNTHVCLKYYENPRNTVSYKLRFCFKCKKNHRSIAESKNHHCLVVVLKTFECLICKQWFHTLKSLRKHDKSKHEPDRS